MKLHIQKFKIYPNNLGVLSGRTFKYLETRFHFLQMSEAFNLKLSLNDSPKDASHADKEMLASALEDEKMALESIYPEAFTERLPNKAW